MTIEWLYGTGESVEADFLCQKFTLPTAVGDLTMTTGTFEFGRRRAGIHRTSSDDDHQTDDDFADVRGNGWRKTSARTRSATTAPSG